MAPATRLRVTYGASVSIVRVPRPLTDGPVHRIECGCGFAVEGVEDEVVAAARRHADDVHGIALADGIVRALAHPIPGPAAGAGPDPHDH